MPREQLEEKLYAPITGAIKSIFDISYLPRSERYGGKPSDNYRPQAGLCIDPLDIKNPHLEITAHGEFSEQLKLMKFNYYMFEQLYAEELHPDILGYALIEYGKKSVSETIAVEVKAHDLRIRDLMQAKLYETVFGAKHTFLLSPQGMSGEKMEVILKHNNLLRGNVIIGRYVEEIKQIFFDPRLIDIVPQGFKRYCRLPPDMQQLKKLWPS